MLTLAAFLALFVWGANAYVYLYTPPASELEVFVVGKQWMWKVQHPGGQREIDEVHLPVNKTVRVVLASEDVIHSFYVPDFRTKHDAVPGQFETFWFQPTEIGQFPLECSEYCGTQHAQMIGEIVVIVRRLTTHVGSPIRACRAPSRIRAPRSSERMDAAAAMIPPAQFMRRRSPDCLAASCIFKTAGSCAPTSAISATASSSSQTQLVAGYPPVMPSFAGQLGEDELVALVAYIQSLSQDKLADDRGYRRASSPII